MSPNRSDERRKVRKVQRVTMRAHQQQLVRAVAVIGGLMTCGAALFLTGCGGSPTGPDGPAIFEGKSWIERTGLLSARSSRWWTGRSPGCRHGLTQRADST